MVGDPVAVQVLSTGYKKTEAAPKSTTAKQFPVGEKSTCSHESNSILAINHM